MTRDQFTAAWWKFCAANQKTLSRMPTFAQWFDEYGHTATAEETLTHAQAAARMY